MQSCSFTGHRQINREHEEYIYDLVLRAINYAYSEGCRAFYCGGAVGFDTICAREVILFKITHPDVKLILLLPCKDQDKLWSDEQKMRYYHTLSAADEIVYVSDEYTKDCMQKRNYELVRVCDMLIGYVSSERSGAAQTFRMAKKMGKTVYNLFPKLESMIK